MIAESLMKIELEVFENIELISEREYLSRRRIGKMGQPAYLTGFRREGGEVPYAVGFSTRGARSAYLRYVEHPEARKHLWVRCIAGRSRKLVRYAG